MSVTVTKKPKISIPGAERRTITEITLDSSYALGGEVVTAAQLGLRHVDAAICSIIHGDEAKSSELFAGVASYSGGKIHVVNLKTGVEVAETKNLEKVVVQVVAFGR
jgi:hypothetical protein